MCFLSSFRTIACGSISADRKMCELPHSVRCTQTQRYRRLHSLRTPRIVYMVPSSPPALLGFLFFFSLKQLGLYRQCWGHELRLQIQHFRTTRVPLPARQATRSIYPPKKRSLDPPQPNLSRSTNIKIHKWGARRCTVERGVPAQFFSIFPGRRHFVPSAALFPCLFPYEAGPDDSSLVVAEGAPRIAPLRCP